MNKQKHPDISVERAYTELVRSFPDYSDYFYNQHFDYYAYPQSFSNTGGPFCKPGGVYGQAFCTFTVEAWVCGKFAVLFCNGKIIKAVNNWEGVGSVRL